MIARPDPYPPLFILGIGAFLYKNDFTFHKIKAGARYLLAVMFLSILIILNIRAYIKCRKDDIFYNQSPKKDAAKSRRSG